MPLELPAEDTLEFLHSESDQAVDDLNLLTSSGGVILGQAKHTLSLEISETSDLASSLDQFVRQFHNAREQLAGTLPQGRELDPAKDRLVIITSSNSSSAIRKDLSDLLTRLRLLVPHKKGVALNTAGSNASEQKALSVVRTHVERSWQVRTGSAPSEAEVGSLLELIHVLVLDVDPEGRDEREARTILRQSILKNPDQADVVWKSWIENQALLARTKAGLNRQQFQQLLIRDGIALLAARSFQDDINRLIDHAKDTASPCLPV